MAPSCLAMATRMATGPGIGVWPDSYRQYWRRDMPRLSAMVFCVIDNAVRALISSLVRIVCFPIVKRLESIQAYQARNLG